MIKDIFDTMNPRIEVSSLAVNKLKNTHDDFNKYDIDVSLDEVENSELGIKIKYKIVLLSNPTNSKLTIEGFASLFGNETEVSKLLEPDQKNIPVIVNIIYQEIFPLIYIISKSLQIPCPSYKLSQISSSTSQEIKHDQVAQNQEIIEQISDSNTATFEEIKTKQTELPSETVPEPIIQEANVSSV